MIKLINIITIFTSLYYSEISLASDRKRKFHYNDTVIVHSSACSDDDFINICGMKGRVVRERKNAIEERFYEVNFTFDNGFVHTARFHEIHLKKVKK